MLKIVLIGAGGFLGSVLRYVAGGLAQRLAGKPDFPYGTLAVNIIGCFLIGFLASLAATRQLFTPETRLFLFVGFLGGFTTYSTFGYEVFSFAHDGQFLNALVNLGLHLVAGLGAVWLGHELAKTV
ncbi:fluoride efflux transporter CrcB [bacterium]|nr:fluoride efflux transporter CrcB [bacterium]